ncbi:helix-turn-helix domain-containing protein [Saccharopolyspora taberi]|uniref:Helix-turn-helix domain-containing protein n=1 Tax=Saccharopolyspora taberi TaxID=60895 RepID=A0ABN3VDM8_9PSEU
MKASPANRPDTVFDPECPARTVLHHVTSRWGTLVLASLRDGPQRFYQLRDRIGGISEKMLSQNLRTFTGYGLVEREVEPTTPPKVTYSLTSRGAEITELLQALVDWVSANTADIVADYEG